MKCVANSKRVELCGKYQMSYIRTHLVLLNNYSLQFFNCLKIRNFYCYIVHWTSMVRDVDENMFVQVGAHTTLCVAPPLPEACFYYIFPYRCNSNFLFNTFILDQLYLFLFDHSFNLVQSSISVKSFQSYHLVM